VLIAATGQVTGDIIARDVTIYGRVDGQIIATEVVDVRARSTVTARVVSGRFILDPDAAFRGRVEPQHLDTAVRVARFQRQQRQKNAG
jgi:cytoskeletal protein CcmA (bactofilin family)